VQLTVDDLEAGDDGTAKIMDMLLSKKRAPIARNGWKRRAIWRRWRRDSTRLRYRAKSGGTGYWRPSK
jgi:hypothetical protein